MAKRKRKRELLSDQLRRLIEDSPMSRYRLSKESGVDASQLCHFIKGTRRLTNDSIDRIGEVLKLRFVVDDK